MKTPTVSKTSKLPEIRATMTSEEKRLIIIACHADPVLFFETFLEDWFPSTITWFHRGIVAILLSKVKFLEKYGEFDLIEENFVFKEDPQDEHSQELPLFHRQEGKTYMRTTPFVMLMLPRGFGKTTLVNACVLYSILYETVKFPFMLSESATHSGTQLNNVKRQLEQNEKLRLVYGNLVPTRQSTLKWTEGQAQTTNGISCYAKGRGGQVRGSNVDGKRPDLIIVDDVEDQESVQSVEQREKTRKWFYEAVIPALEMGSKGRILMACTLLHREALASTLMRDSEWTTVIFGAFGKDGKPLWPEKMDENALNRKRNSFAMIGNLAGYYREYHNTLRHEDSQKFKPEYIKHSAYDRKDFITISMVLDPAISQRKGADYCSLAVVGLLESGEMNVLECFSQIGMTPREQIDKYFELYALWRPMQCGIESIAFQQSLIYSTREEMSRRGLFFEIKPITHGRIDKTTRVEGVLQGRYASGFVSHRVSFPILEQQLYDWPNGKKDAPDAVAMAVTLLEPYTGISFNSGSYMPEMNQQLVENTIDINGAP